MPRDTPSQLGELVLLALALRAIARSDCARRAAHSVTRAEKVREAQLQAGLPPLICCHFPQPIERNRKLLRFLCLFHHHVVEIGHIPFSNLDGVYRLLEIGRIRNINVQFFTDRESDVQPNAVFLRACRPCDREYFDQQGLGPKDVILYSDPFVGWC